MSGHKEPNPSAPKGVQRPKAPIAPPKSDALKAEIEGAKELIERNEFLRDQVKDVCTMCDALKAENAALVKALEAMNKAVCDLKMVFGKQAGKTQLLAAYQQSLDALAEHDAEEGRNDEEHTCKTCCWDDPPEDPSQDEFDSWLMECPPCDRLDHDDVSGCEEHWEKKSSLYGFAEKGQNNEKED